MKILLLVTLLSFAFSSFSAERIVFDSQGVAEEGLVSYTNPRIKLYDGDSSEFPIAPMQSGELCRRLGHGKGVMRAETKEVWTRVATNLYELFVNDKLILENNLKGEGNTRDHGTAIAYLVCQ